MRGRLSGYSGPVRWAVAIVVLLAARPDGFLSATPRSPAQAPDHRGMATSSRRSRGRLLAHRSVAPRHHAIPPSRTGPRVAPADRAENDALRPVRGLQDPAPRPHP